ncbi:MAG: TlpA disulfide reductase family protein [Saprospiraceae bacterium]
MIKRNILSGLLLFALSFSVSSLLAQDVALIKKEQLFAWKNTTADSIYVVNFWATWCAPCVKELPAFDSLQQAYAELPLQVILVSTDFRKNLESKVLPFVEKKQIQSTVVFMDERNPNDYIDLLNPEWSGAIPATFIFSGKNKKTAFHEGDLSYKELEDLLLETIQE